MKFKGKIKNLEHIVISDPSYKKGVWCRYETDNLNEKNWNVSLDIYPVEIKEGKYYTKGTEFYLLLQKNKGDCKISSDGHLKYLSDIELNDYTIGMDTACIALGINNNAKDIISSKGEWQPNCAIRTGTDGTFGNVAEGVKNGKLRFLLITGFFEEDFIDENELFEYLKNQFEITELEKEDITLIGDDRELEKGDIVEVSTCSITNNAKGTSTIRNFSYKSETEGMNLTIENPDGTIEHSVLESFDELVDELIQVQVVESFYDYETGYHYKGKIINEKLIEELSNNKLYNKKSEEGMIINFSEFDVVKLLEKNYDKKEINVEI